MSTSAKDYYENNAAAMRPAREAMGTTLKAFGGLHHAAMTAGALSTKDKELMAMAIGLAIRCESCIFAHVQAALKAGATRDEVVEAAQVAVMMGGGPVYTYVPKVFEALEALEA